MVELLIVEYGFMSQEVESLSGFEGQAKMYSSGNS